MSDDRIALLVLGLGNVLCGDDGAGVEAVERLLAGWELPESVRVLDGGTLGLSLLPYLQSADRVILVDAVLVEARPGTIVHFAGDDVVSVARGRMSCHQIGVADVLDCARLLGELPEVSLVGIAAKDVGAMTAPTCEVASRIDALVEALVEEMRAAGFEPSRRRVPRRGFSDWPTRASRPSDLTPTAAEERPDEAGLEATWCGTAVRAGSRGGM